MAAFILATLVLLSGGFARAGVITKAGTGTDLASGASWGGSAPGYLDVATWTGGSLGAGLDFHDGTYWAGISVTSALSDISVSGYGYIQLGAGGIDMSAARVNMSLDQFIILGTNQTWNVNAGESLNVSGPVSGSWNLVKNGFGTLILSGNNPITGVTTVNAGTLVISGQLHYNESWQSINALTINPGAAVTVSSGDAANFLGQCNFDAAFNTIDGGALQFATQTGTAESIYRAFTIGGNGATLEVLNPNATLTFEYFSAPMQFTVPAAASLTLAGNGNGVMNKTISGAGGVIKSGSGTWTLNGANNYTGPTIVSNGPLVVNGSLWYGPVTVAPGGMLGGTGVIFGSITFLPGAQAQFTNGAATSWNGSLTLNDNVVQVALANSMPPGSYVLATYQPAGTTGSFHSAPMITSGSLASGYSARIKTDRGNVTLIVLPPPGPHLAILSVNGGSNAAAGLGFSVAVQAQDANNNPLPMPADTPVSLILGSGYGTLGGNLAGTIPAGGNSTIINGVTYTLDEAAVVITATNTTLLPGDSAPFAVNLGPATTMTLLSTGPLTSGPGTALPNPFVVKVTDPGGNVVPGTRVTFAIAATPGGATGQSLSVANATVGLDGLASSTLTLGNRLGTYAVTATLNGPNQNVVTITATAANNKWTQVWSDEFNYNGLPDSNKWNYENGFVRNGEYQYYTTNRIENACVTNGMLAITARKEAYTPPGQSSPVASYTSASLITLGKESWTYGRLEMRAKMPSPIGGVWTAFWTQGTNFPDVGWPLCGELDVAEWVNWNPNPHGNAFWGYNGGSVGDGYIYYTPGTYDDFHIYAAEWDSDKIDFFYDTTNYYTIYVDEAGSGPSNPFRNPQYILLDFALGGAWGGLIYDPGLPQQFLIDYVRVYQLTPSAASLSVPVVRNDGAVQLTFWGVNSSLEYRIQVNSDLTTTNWTTLFTNVAVTNGSATFIDTAAPNNARRFYRIVSP